MGLIIINLNQHDFLSFPGLFSLRIVARFTQIFPSQTSGIGCYFSHASIAFNRENFSGLYRLVETSAPIRPAMAHNQYRLLIPAQAVIAVGTHGHDFLDLLHVTGHGPLDDKLLVSRAREHFVLQDNYTHSVRTWISRAEGLKKPLSKEGKFLRRERL